MKKIVIFFFSLIFTCSLWTIDSIPTGTPFLNFPIGARILGMGDCGSALKNDIYTIYYNPGMIYTINRRVISYTHYEWIKNSRYEYIAFTEPLFDGTAASAIHIFYAPSIDVYNNIGNKEKNTFLFDFKANTGYSHKIGPIGLGGTINFIVHYLKGMNKAIFSMSSTIGIHYELMLPDFNIGPLKFLNRSIQLSLSFINIPLGLSINGTQPPFTIRTGASSEIYKNLILTIEFIKEMIDIKSLPTIGIGAEYWLFGMVGFRLGYRFAGADVDKFTIGIGFKHKITKKLKIEINYAFAPPLNKDLALATIGTLSATLVFPIRLRASYWERLNTLYYKGIKFFTAEEFDKAIRVWQKCLKINPNFSRARDKIKEAEIMKKLQLEETEELRNMYLEQTGKKNK